MTETPDMGGERTDAADRFRFATTGMPVRAAFDAYHHLYAAGADPWLEADDFRAVMTSRRFSRMTLHDRRIHAVGHRRAAPRVRHDDFSHFTATICLSGTVHGSADDGFRQVHPGELLLLDMSRPMQTQVRSAHLLTVGIGREVVEGAGGDARRLHGRILDRVAAAPVVRYLAGLTLSARTDDRSTCLPVERLAGLLEPALDPGSEAAALRGRRLFAARRLIEARLSDPGLNPSAIAAALGMSRATTYRLFSPYGGIDRYIIDQRLLRLRRLLSAPGLRASIATLAGDVGFLSDSHASRAFLERFGTRPGSFRHEAAGLSEARHAALRMALWQAELR